MIALARSLATVLFAFFATAPVFAQAANAPVIADPWPRTIAVGDASMLVYQPQVNTWDGHTLDFRAAMALKVPGAAEERFGTVFGTARTQVDKVARTVVLSNLNVAKADFPLLPDRGASYAARLQQAVASDMRTVSLDRLEAALAAAGVKPPPVAIDNTPPQVIVAYVPAMLVPVDGAPVLKPVPDAVGLQRVVNTRALILRTGIVPTYYLHVYDGWMSAPAIEGPWTVASPGPFERRKLDDAATALAKKGVVDLLDGGPKANPKPSLGNGAPAIHIARGPAELVQFDGQPDFVPIVGTQLLWASNTHSDVLIDTTTSRYYVLLAGRWFASGGLNGPWTFVASDALPGDFARIPAQSRAGAVLPSVAGTPQAQSALIANTIPQSASVPRVNGPTFTPTFDGAPQYRPVTGTPLSFVVNTGTPILRVDDRTFLAVSGGVWFSAPAVTGPWAVATSVPAVVYTIPASSPLHYVTYVRIYEATPQVVYVGYTPGYLGTVVSPSGTVVYGTGYAYTPWIGDIWYPAPVTYTVAATPIYNPYAGFTFGFAMGLAAATWTTPYYGGAWYHPAYWGGYPCCASASANVYGQWGNTVTSGTRSWYAGGGVAGSTASGSYYNQRTGTSGSYNAGRQYNAWTGNATRGYDRTINTPAGGSGEVARAGNYNTYTGQRTTANAASGTTAGGSSYQRAGTTTAGPQGYAHAGGGSTYNARTGETNTWNTASVGNNHYADVNGNVYRNTGNGWEQHDDSGSWSHASGNTSWADRESQARSEGAERFGSFSSSEASRFGGGDRFAGGGGGWGGRFGGGGFGGGGFRGRR